MHIIINYFQEKINLNIKNPIFLKLGSNNNIIKDIYILIVRHTHMATYYVPYYILDIGML